MITIREKNYRLNVNLDEQICDISNVIMISSLDFIQDETNCIFIIENKTIGLSSDYFIPPRDDQIIYNCFSGFIELEEKINENTAIEYINMESLGIILDDKIIGVLVEKDRLLNALKISQIIKLEVTELDVIRSVTSKAYYLNPKSHGMRSALHCQGGYTGVVFNPIPCTELITNNNIFTEEQNLILSKFNGENFFGLDEEDQEFLKDNINYLNLPEKYYLICKKENSYNNLENYDYLIDLYDSKSILDENINYNNVISLVNLPDSQINNYSLFKFIKSIINVDYMVIAGEFPLYLIKNQWDIDEVNVDLYLHTCSNLTGRRIIREICKSYYITDIIDYQDKIIVKSKNFTNKIIIHKKIYNSPSEIAHSFDIDCLCILFDFKRERFFVTERGLYSIRNNINVIYKLSSNYERRLLRYTSFDIYIPQFKYFKYNFNIDLSNNLNGNIINQYMLSNFKYPDLDIIEYGINYNKSEITNLILNLEFVTDTYENLINKEWYPILIEDHIIYDYPYDNNELKVYEDKFSNPNYKTNIKASYNLYCDNITNTKYEDKLQYDFIKLLSSGNIGNVIAFGNYITGNFIQKNIEYPVFEICFINIDKDTFDKYVSLLIDGYKSYNIEYVDDKIKTKINRRKEYITIEYSNSNIIPLKIHNYIGKNINDIYKYLKRNKYELIVMLRYYNEKKEFIISDYDKFFLDNKLIINNPYTYLFSLNYDNNDIPSYRKIISDKLHLETIENIFDNYKYNDSKCDIRLIKDNIKKLYAYFNISLIGEGNIELIQSEEYQKSLKILQEQQLEREKHIEKQRIRALENMTEDDRIRFEEEEVEQNQLEEPDEEQFRIEEDFRNQEESYIEEDEEERLRLEQYWEGVDEDEERYDEDEERYDEDEERYDEDEDEILINSSDNEYRNLYYKISSMLDELLYLKRELNNNITSTEKDELLNDYKRVKNEIEEELDFTNKIFIVKLINDINNSEITLPLLEIGYNILREEYRNNFTIKDELLKIITLLIDDLELKFHLLDGNSELYNIYQNRLEILYNEEIRLKV